MTEFDPAEHRMVPQQRWFEEILRSASVLSFPAAP